MRDAGIIHTIFVRELVRLADWLTGFESTSEAWQHATWAMAALFRESAYLLETPEGPWERLYRLAWDYRMRESRGGVEARFETVAVTVPRPHPDHARELCWAYWSIALISAQQDVPISQIIIVMKAIAEYEFEIEDVFGLLSRLDDPSNASTVIETVLGRADDHEWHCANCVSAAAQLQRSEIEKTEKWIDSILL